MLKYLLLHFQFANNQTVCLIIVHYYQPVKCILSVMNASTLIFIVIRSLNSHVDVKMEETH